MKSSHNQPCIVLDNYLKQKYEEYGLYKEELLSPFSTFQNSDTQSALIFANGIKLMVNRLNSQSIVDDRTLEKHRWLINEFKRYFKNYCQITFIESPSHFEIQISTDVNYKTLVVRND